MMGQGKRIFSLSIFVNVVIMIYALYCVREFDYEWCGCTFVGVFLWTVGIVLAAPVDRTPKWYRLGKLLDYPLLPLVIFMLLVHASGLFDFLIKAAIFSGVGELLTYALQRKINRNVILAYYSALLILAWVLLYEYPLIPLSYSLFVSYCTVSLIQLSSPKETGG